MSTRISNAASSLAQEKVRLLEMTQKIISDNARKNIDAEIQKLVLRNFYITNNTGFWFKGNYFGTLATRGISTAASVLDISLRPEMEKIYENLLSLKVQSINAAEYCRKALRISNTLGQYISLLPDQLSQNILDAHHQDGYVFILSAIREDSFPAEFVEEFKKKYEKEEQLLKMQLVCNLLEG